MDERRRIGYEATRNCCERPDDVARAMEQDNEKRFVRSSLKNESAALLGDG